MNKKEIQKINNEELPLSFANKIPDKFIQRENCKLCKSEFREKIEAEYSKTDSLKAAWRLAEQLDQENLSYWSVRRHLINHYVAHQRALALKEYTKTLLETVVSKRYNRRKQTIDRIYMLQHRMAELESLTEGTSVAEMVKTADAIKKLADSITAHEKEVEAIDKKFEPVTILINNLLSMMHEEIKKKDDPKISECLTHIYERLTQSVQDTFIEKE